MDNVHCFHSAAKILSELTGLSMEIEETLPNWEATRIKTKTRGSRGLYSIHDLFVEKDGIRYYQPRVQILKGDIKIFRVSNMRSDIKKERDIWIHKEEQDFPFDTRWNKIGVFRYRPLKDYGFPIEPIGKYRDSLGGGWYSDIPLYQIGPVQCAPDMECAH